MPAAAAVWVGTFVVGALGATGAAVVAGVVTMGITYGVVVLGASYALGAVSQALTGRPKTGGNPRYRDMVIKATTAPRAIIYGEVTTGGVLVFEHTTGTKNEWLDFVIAIAGHQVESITDVWFDDVKIVNADIGSGASAGGAVGGSGDFRARDGTTVAYVYKYLGTSAQNASTVLSATDGTGYGPTMWSSAHRLRGVAYVHIRLRRNEKAYGQGAPSNFKFKVKGSKVYDPRLDTTNGGSGPHRYTDASTWTWSNNPALCVSDYLIGGSIVNDQTTPIAKRGFGAATADVDWPSVIAAANICEESVSLPSGSQDRYECDGVVFPSDDNPDADCLDQILTAMLGNVTYTNGKYEVYAGAYQSPAYTLTEADLAGPLQYVTAKGRADRYNTVRGTRMDADSGQVLEFLSRTDSSYVTADGRALYHDIDLPMTLDEYRAQRIGQVVLRRSREQQSLVWPGQLSCAKIAVWETVQVTVAEFGITAKVFRCVSRKTRPTSEGDPIIELMLREENSSTYSDPASGDYGSLTVATDPGPITGMLDPPSNLVVTAVPNGLQFTITPDDGAGSAEVYDIYEHTSATPFASATLVYSGNSTVVFLPKSDTTVRYYWVQARRNSYISETFPATNGIPSGAGAGSTVLAVSADYSSLTTNGSGTTVTSATVTATAIRGTSPYTYAWTKVSGDTITIGSAATAGTTFSAATMASGESRTATFRCTATDNVAATATVDVVITLTRTSFSVSISPISLHKYGSTSGLTTATATATATGGVTTYSYAWTKVSGDSITIDSASSAATTFSAAGMAVDEQRTALFRVTATDSTGGTPLTATSDINVTIDRISYS